MGRISSSHPPSANRAGGDHRVGVLDGDVAGDEPQLGFADNGLLRCGSGHTVLRLALGLQLDPLVAIDAKDPARAHQRLLVDVLVPVQEQPWLNAVDILQARVEAEVDLILAVMDMPRRVVRDEHVNGWETREQPPGLGLVVEVVAPRLVLP